MNHVLIKRGRFEDPEETHQEKDHVMMEKETVVMKLKAKECQQSPEARRKA